eukprot:TRINITY_DN2315_c2_g1_i2.p1 TRINITY_DN2315_c2_g1~~TRINITY_DN2315_c2_g1_i2.p1  ORF type:complete len:1693 (+),score=401.59 TRINITY_DN2315_c2_g1_i2:338-5080(+)
MLEPESAWLPFHSILIDLTNDSKHSSLKLAEVSPFLNNLSGLSIPIPTESVVSGEGVLLHSIDKTLSVLHTKTKPKKIILIGTDGRSYPFLLKGREDLHLDARIMQLIELINSALAADPHAKPRRLAAQTYNVTPLSQSTGLIRWIEQSISLFSFYKQWLKRNAEVTKGFTRPSELFHSKVVPALKAHGVGQAVSRSEWPVQVLSAVYLALVAETPSDLFSREMWLSSPTTAQSIFKQRAFARTCAVTSIIGYIIGLGDRHLDNILLDQHTGHLVHIDYNVCFEKGASLRVPERVPFRLTPQLIDAMGVGALSGVFRVSAEHTLRVVRKHKETIMTLLDAFVYDPLVDWTTAKVDREERKSMELHVTLSLFSSKIAECLPALQLHWAPLRSSLLEVLPIAEKVAEWVRAQSASQAQVEQVFHRKIELEQLIQKLVQQETALSSTAQANTEALVSLTNSERQLKQKLGALVSECAAINAKDRKLIAALRGGAFSTLSKAVDSAAVLTDAQRLRLSEAVAAMGDDVGPLFVTWQSQAEDFAALVLRDCASLSQSIETFRNFIVSAFPDGKYSEHSVAAECGELLQRGLSGDMTAFATLRTSVLADRTLRAQRVAKEFARLSQAADVRAAQEQVEQNQLRLQEISQRVNMSRQALAQAVTTTSHPQNIPRAACVVFARWAAELSQLCRSPTGLQREQMTLIPVVPPNVSVGDLCRAAASVCSAAVSVSSGTVSNSDAFVVLGGFATSISQTLEKLAAAVQIDGQSVAQLRKSPRLQMLGSVVLRLHTAASAFLSEPLSVATFFSATTSAFSPELSDVPLLLAEYQQLCMPAAGGELEVDAHLLNAVENAFSPMTVAAERLGEYWVTCLREPQARTAFPVVNWLALRKILMIGQIFAAKLGDATTSADALLVPFETTCVQILQSVVSPLFDSLSASATLAHYIELYQAQLQNPAQPLEVIQRGLPHGQSIESLAQVLQECAEDQESLRALSEKTKQLEIVATERATQGETSKAALRQFEWLHSDLLLSMQGSAVNLGAESPAQLRATLVEQLETALQHLNASGRQFADHVAQLDVLVPKWAKRLWVQGPVRAGPAHGKQSQTQQTGAQPQQRAMADAVAICQDQKNRVREAVATAASFVAALSGFERLRDSATAFAAAHANSILEYEKACHGLRAASNALSTATAAAATVRQQLATAQVDYAAVTADLQRIAPPNDSSNTEAAAQLAQRVMQLLRTDATELAEITGQANAALHAAESNGAVRHLCAGLKSLVTILQSVGRDCNMLLATILPALASSADAPGVVGVISMSIERFVAQRERIQTALPALQSMLIRSLASEQGELEPDESLELPQDPGTGSDVEDEQEEDEEEEQEEEEEEEEEGDADADSSGSSESQSDPEAEQLARQREQERVREAARRRRQAEDLEQQQAAERLVASTLLGDVFGDDKEAAMSTLVFETTSQGAELQEKNADARAHDERIEHQTASALQQGEPLGHALQVRKAPSIGTAGGSGRAAIAAEPFLNRVPERNQHAIAALKRVRAKLEGRDDSERRLSVGEQVEVLINNATNIEYLCTMYEGWTPWV